MLFLSICKQNWNLLIDFTRNPECNISWVVGAALFVVGRWIDIQDKASSDYSLCECTSKGAQNFPLFFVSVCHFLYQMNTLLFGHCFVQINTYNAEECPGCHICVCYVGLHICIIFIHAGKRFNNYILCLCTGCMIWVSYHI